MSNLSLWSQVETTDINFTKQVPQRGGFTAINAQYQIKKATEVFGPYGGKWGVRECTYSYTGDNELCMLEAVFYTPHGEFEISTDIKMKTKSGFIEDHRKKLLTDLTTKALSKLGFNADIFLGMYEDNKYVNARKAEAKSNEEEKRLKDFIASAKTIEKLESIQPFLSDYGADMPLLYEQKYNQLQTSK